MQEFRQYRSVFEHLGPAAVKAHIYSLRADYLQRMLRPCLGKLMLHIANKGIFNNPVDPRLAFAPNYYQIIKHPMDLGTVKTKLHALSYSNIYEFIDDVRTTFNNALIYNPPKHLVHESAKKIWMEFEEEVDKIEARWRSFTTSLHSIGGK